ncbi:thiamine diphosphokinase [Pukyongiella litopenaei]|uniref:Thiamine diphosphokinase n=1 Tax=Pukyongiella litopenaei TaxID=2605946 RepID=A0A2S0MMQ3_9RHOB|nr:thiamine diphosphokinase [Pukyongiella litopenaei]AVO36963.1 thiamine diphosphokinase [Pukyongiella litopenaei]
MQQPILQSEQPVTLLGGGALYPGDLDLALSHAPTLAAADGGARAALRAGHMPVAVFGDFDSLDDRSRAALPADRLHRITEQDSTDFDKALRNIQAPVVVAAGFLGARMDHQLAALSTLLRHCDRRCVLIGEREVVFHAPPRIVVPVASGDVVSLFPLCPATGRSTGLRWPIDGLELAPGGRIGTSNVATGPVGLDTDGPGLLVILPRVRLGDVIPALAAAPVHPARQ